MTTNWKCLDCGQTNRTNADTCQYCFTINESPQFVVFNHQDGEPYYSESDTLLYRKIVHLNDILEGIHKTRGERFPTDFLMDLARVFTDFYFFHVETNNNPRLSMISYRHFIRSFCDRFGYKEHSQWFNYVKTKKTRERLDKEINKFLDSKRMI